MDQNSTSPLWIFSKMQKKIMLQQFGLVRKVKNPWTQKTGDVTYETTWHNHK